MTGTAPCVQEAGLDPQAAWAQLVNSRWCRKEVLAADTGEGNGTPLQCSCLENPRDGGDWWAGVYGVAQSQTRLKRLSS